ncbi:unnamed protein product [Rotaria sp. Silwood1]|nr:unnamed protein product [Rotaria sp. Silwood1]CAF3764800.1 unnamed protein product [Rotaria sp. Silwood1]CAF4643183.1 unnamed protein product [Rotaria sp. Silwood1]CAF4672344.1 unnamed protein product [Rotaria sp. Silwood1]CAF4693696.1 unnamed protein product [Rotaria sp. Silwood1]
MSISESFVRIEIWLSKNAPDVFRAKFLPSVREAYTFHNGESTESKGLFGGWRWLPLYEIIQRNDEQKNNNVQKHHFVDFKPSFVIPLLISTISMSVLRYVDTSEDNGQEETSVIERDHKQPIRDYLSTFAERLELGEYIPGVNDQEKTRDLILKK